MYAWFIFPVAVPDCSPITLELSGGTEAFPPSAPGGDGGGGSHAECPVSWTLGNLPSTCMHELAWTHGLRHNSMHGLC